ncbi:MAG: hypothetical protein J0H40_19195 [Rhizobiales bacterium]|nr:hypothetical protein [Hyphomicrobiales bacterium]
MLGTLIAQLDRPELTAQVLDTLDPDLAIAIEMRAADASMATAEFVAGAIRAFIDSADDDLWFQMLTVIRKADDPGLTAVQTILKWVATERQSAA